MRFRDYREMIRGGGAAFDVPVLLVDVTPPQTAVEFRTRSASEAPPTLRASALASPDAALLRIEKSDRNPYGAFVFVGRGSSSDIVLKHHSVSKSHAWFEQQGEKWFLHDNRSRNGTFVDGIRVPAGANVALRGGCLVTFGTMPSYFLLPRDLAELIR